MTKFTKEQQAYLERHVHMIDENSRDCTGQKQPLGIEWIDNDVGGVRGDVAYVRGCVDVVDGDVGIVVGKVDMVDSGVGLVRGDVGFCVKNMVDVVYNEDEDKYEHE